MLLKPDLGSRKRLNKILRLYDILFLWFLVKAAKLRDMFWYCVFEVFEGCWYGFDDFICNAIRIMF